MRRFRPYYDRTIRSSDITDETVYLNRRQLLGAGAALGLSSMLPRGANAEQMLRPLKYVNASESGWDKDVDDQLTPYADVTSYNNFYEFGMDKSAPAKYAHQMTIDPWSIDVTGLEGGDQTIPLESVLARMTLEERIYRLRCVEAWSMVIPWVGFPLADLVEWLRPNSKAKYVVFETLHRPKEMRGTRSFSAVIDWPYQEALRLDEAMNPLAFIAVGLYGKSLPNQNGAPLRLVVPWKYGFKNIKSIARIGFVESQPATSWQQIAPHEYGFFANVNPSVDHPRWSQRFERRLPSSLFSPNRIPTQLFNGYADQVAGLYKGMDLALNY
jgi:methionine sulfoxide reductase catalytic subunit